MSKTNLRLIGGGILLFNLWLCGNYNITGVPLLLLTVGFAFGFEYLIVRPVTADTPPANDNARQAQPGHSEADASERKP